jgi:hypothetical protein
MRRNVRDCARDYLSEFGSESFRGENFVRVAINFCADAGVGTAPFSLNSEVEVGFMQISWSILVSCLGLRIQLRRSWDTVR